MGIISTSPRYVIDITEMDLDPFEGVGGGGAIRAKIRKMRYFLTYERVIGSY